MKFESPEYVGVIECGPSTREDAENVAWPLVLIVTVDSMVEPSLNAMVPVGVPAPGAATLTVAVNVTGPLRIEGFADETTVVSVGAELTACVSVPVLA